MLCWVVRWKSYKKVFVLWKIKMVNVQYFYSTWHVSPGKHLCDLIDTWVYLASWQTLPYLVLTMFSPSFILSLSTMVSYDIFFICSCPLACELFLVPCYTMCTLTVITIVMSGLVGVWLWIILVWSRMASSGSVCVFPSLVTHVFFCCYGCWLDVLSVTCNYFPCSGDLYFVWPVVVIVIALSNNHTMGPWFPVLPLSCYSWPYGDRY